MVQPIRSSPNPAPSATPPATGGLRAQLAEAERRLAACETCAGASTPQGRARTQAAATQVQALRSRLDGLESAPQAPTGGQDRPAPASPLPGGSLDLTT